MSSVKYRWLIVSNQIELQQQSMVHHRKYPLFYLRPLPWGQGYTKCCPVSSTSVIYAPAKFEVATPDGLEDAFTRKS